MQGEAAGAGAGWDPGQYGKFRDERAQPFHDLLSLVVPVPGIRVVDLGCGTGELTLILHRSLGAAETLGVDNSPEMLAAAARIDEPGLRFRAGDLARFEEPGAWDLVFANASLQWADDHPALLARLAASLRPGGQIAVQVPRNQEHPSQIVAREVAREEPFDAALGGAERLSPVLPPVDYARILHRLGFVEQHVREAVYAHLLPGREAVLEWVKGTTLTACRSRLPAPLYDRFLARYAEALLPRLPDERPFLFPFPRVLFRARLPGG